MMRAILRLLLAPFRAGFCYIGGDSEANQTTDQIDRRVTGGDNGAQVSGDGNTVMVTSSDHGAVLAGTELARHSLDVGALMAGLSLQQSGAAFNAATKAIGDAYSTARAGDQRVVSMVGLAVLGMVGALALFGKAR